MAIRDAFKITRKTFFDPLGWVGYEGLKRNTSVIWGNLKSIGEPEQATRAETFEEAMQRLNLTEENVKDTETRYLIYSLVFVALAAISFAWGFILLIGYKKFAGFILALLCVSLFFAFAFRYHFWYFQIKHRKLGCTFEEWWSGAVSNKDAS